MGSEQVVKMGSELWSRLNGVVPGEEMTSGRNITALRQALTADPVVLALAQV